MADEKMIITIGREHGTMGDKVAEKIRRQFELPLYDKAHLLRVVEGTDDYDELNAFFNDRKVNSLLYAIAMSENVSSNDVPFRICLLYTSRSRADQPALLETGLREND